MGVRNPYQTYGLSHLINSYLQAMSAAPPPHPSVMGTEPTFPPDLPPPAPEEAVPEGAPSTFSTKMRAAREGQKAVGRELALSPEDSAKRPFKDKMRAAREGQKAVGKEMDKAATQGFIERMKAGQAAAQAARGGGGAVAPPEPAMPMIPPQAIEPWKTPYTTQGVAGENAIGRELFGTGQRRNWPPEPSEE